MSTGSTPTTTVGELVTEHLRGDAHRDGSQLTEQIEALLESVEDLATQLDQERTARKAVEERLDNLEQQRRADIHALARENHEQRHQQGEDREQQEDNHEQIEELEDTVSEHSLLVEALRKRGTRIEANEDAIDEINETLENGTNHVSEREDAETAAGSIAQTVLERITVLPESFSESTNFQRARFLAMDLRKYARKGPYGGYILDPERIKNTLYAHEKNPAAAHDQTVDRVREIMAEQGGDDVTIEKAGRKKVVSFSEEIVSRLTNLGKIRKQAPSLVCEGESEVGG